MKFLIQNNNEEVQSTTHPVTKEQQTQNAKKQNKATKNKKSAQNKQDKPQMSKEEQMLREQRRQIIADINEYLNDQYNQPAIRPLQTEEQEERQREIQQRNNDLEEEKVADEEEEYDKNQASTFQSEDEFFQAFGDAISANVDIEVVDDTVKANKQSKGKKKNILEPMMYSGMFYPPSVTRQALEEEQEADDEDQIKDNAYYPFQYVSDQTYVQNELPGIQNTDSGSSFSYFILILFMIIGSIYYVLQEAIKRRQREEEPEKYESGGDNLLGENGNGASDQVAKYLSVAQRMAERLARGLLDQIENRYRIDDDDVHPNFNNANNSQNNEGPIVGAKPLSSLASQSEPILGSTTASNSNDSYGAASPHSIVKKKKKTSEKKKQLEEMQDDNYDQA